VGLIRACVARVFRAFPRAFWNGEIATQKTFAYCVAGAAAFADIVLNDNIPFGGALPGRVFLLRPGLVGRVRCFYRDRVRTFCSLELWCAASVTRLFVLVA
jgi:hypothetical protein